MAVQIRFSDVSKRYQLGLSRMSLPGLLSNSLKQIAGGRRQEKTSSNEFWALHHVGFELHEGESLALIGQNGAGKTTILKLLANITKPTSGTVETYGKLSALIELGAGFHPDLTGRENVFLNGSILGINRRMITSRFDEIVAFSELERFIDTPVKRYSSGMIVRLGFAIASCIEPQILLVDEVLAVGDAAFQQKCLKRIHTLIHNGTSIVFVSHNFYLVQAICNTALYLQNGQMQHYGATKDVIAMYEQYLHQERARKFARGVQVASDDEDEIEITQVEVLCGDGLAAALLFSNQPVQIRIHYNAYKSLGKVQVSTFIIRSDGLTCCMMRTKLDNFELFVEYGQGIVSLQLDPLQLVSGTYFAEAWFLNESDSSGITSKGGRSDWFTVKGAALSYEERSGIFEPNTHWAHSPIDKIISNEGLEKQTINSLPLTTPALASHSQL